MLNNLVPELRVLPNEANHFPPRRQIVYTNNHSPVTSNFKNCNTYRRHGYSFNICYGRWATKYSNICWERRFEPWFSLFSFNRLNQGRLFATDVCTCTSMDKYIKIVTRSTSIFTNQSCLICL